MDRSTQYELVQAHIPYRQVFKLASPKRKIWCDWFVEQMDLRIEVVDPSDAPVAYDVRFGPEDSPRQFGYPIRSYENGLWWPVGGDYNYILHPETFATMLKDGHPETLILLDPSFAGCIEQRPLPTFPKDYRRVDHDWNDLVNQQAIAQRGASTTNLRRRHVRQGRRAALLRSPPTAPTATKTSSWPSASPTRNGSRTVRAGPSPGQSGRPECRRRGAALLSASERSTKPCGTWKRVGTRWIGKTPSTS